MHVLKAFYKAVLKVRVKEQLWPYYPSVATLQHMAATISRILPNQKVHENRQKKIAQNPKTIGQAITPYWIRRGSFCTSSRLHVLRRIVLHSLVLRPQVDFLGICHEAHLEIQERHGEGRWRHQDLSLWRQKLHQLFNDGLELWTQERVSCIHGNHAATSQVYRFHICQVTDPTRRSNQNVNMKKSMDVFENTFSICWDQALDTHVLANSFHHSKCLQCQFPSGN